VIHLDNPDLRLPLRSLRKLKTAQNEAAFQTPSPGWCFGTSQRGKSPPEEEEEAVKDMLWQLVIRFSDEGDDAAD